MRRHAAVVVLCALAFIALSALPVRADMPAAGALSTSSAVLGAEGWYAGALPPPGFHFINYFLYYTASEMKGRRGRHVSGAPFTDFQADVYAMVLRPIYVADCTIFGANPAWHACIPVASVNQRSDFFRDRTSGLGDIYVSPLILGWHRPPWHYVAGLDVIMPTGRYSSRDITVIGNNHWTFEPAFALSYIGQSGFSASTKLMYDIHTEDTTLHYQEGQQFHMDYNVGYSFGEQRAYKVGVCGYYLTSVEDDEVNSNTLSDSKERVLAIGPTVAYQKGKWMLALKVQKEIEAKNRPKGVSSWLKLVYSF